MKLNNILRRSIITEKSLRLASQSQWFTFEVDKKASKIDIARAVKELFGVDVLEVRTMNVRGKKRRVGRVRREIQTSSWKKALVKLKKGQRIDLFDVS